MRRHRSRSPSRLVRALSALHREWLEAWAWGNSGAVDVVRNAKNSFEGGTKDEVARRLARWCDNPGNAERVVESVVEGWVNCMPGPIAIHDSQIVYVLLPFDMVMSLQKASPNKFRTRFGAKDNGIQQFWQLWLQLVAIAIPHE